MPPVAAGGFRLAAVTLILTGFATFTFEVAWTRVFSIMLGPSTYAFAATLTGFIGGLALGAVAGAFLCGRLRRPASALVVSLTCAAIAAAAAGIGAGGPVLRLLLTSLGGPPPAFGWVLLTRAVVAVALIGPLAFFLGVSFPLSLELSGHSKDGMARRLGSLFTP